MSDVCPLLPFFRVLPKDHEHLPDLLHRVRRQPLADRREPCVAVRPFGGRGAHLDQLVRLEGAVDLGQHLVGEPLVADDDDGAEGVGFGAQLAAFLRGKRIHRGSISK